MEIATTFEDRHGGHPPMYFARYTEDNTIRITVLTPKTDKELRKCFRRLGIFKILIMPKGGSWEHCHMYQAAKHVFPKRPVAVQDVVHWLFNMLNYNYFQECSAHIQLSAHFMSGLIRLPNEEIKATETTPGEASHAPAKSKSRRS
jgi:hypothetical protein